MEAPPEHIRGKKVILKWVRVSITTSGSGTNLESLLSIYFKKTKKNKFETFLNLKIQILGCGSMEPTNRYPGHRTDDGMLRPQTSSVGSAMEENIRKNMG